MRREPLLVVCAAWACLGMVCVGPDGPTPTLPEVRIADIHLQVMEAGDSRAAVALAWDWPDSLDRPDWFEVYQGTRADSLGLPAVLRPGDSRSALIRLPDSARPFRMYYGVRAVVQEPTGQKIYGRSIPADSLLVNSAFTILSPVPGRVYAGRTLEVEVSTASEDGITYLQTLYQKQPEGWSALLEACLPKDACGAQSYSDDVQRDLVTTPSVASGDTVETLICILGNESFEGIATGRKQSLACSRFFRTAP